MPSEAERILTSFDNEELLEATLAEATRIALRQHKLAGHPIVVGRDGEAIWIPADQIELDAETADKARAHQ